MTEGGRNAVKGGHRAVTTVGKPGPIPPGPSERLGGAQLRTLAHPHPEAEVRKRGWQRVPPAGLVQVRTDLRTELRVPGEGLPAPPPGEGHPCP